MQAQAQSSLYAANLDFPLRLSRWVSDIQRKNVVVLHSQSTIAEAIDWLAYSCGQTVPVMNAENNRPTVISMRMVDAKTLLQALLQQMLDHTCSLADFFAISLNKLSGRRPGIVYPELDLVSAVGRLYRERNDLLLVSQGLHLCGLVMACDIFDVMIGSAVLDNALFNTQSDQPGEDAILETARVCCFQQPVSFVYDTTPLHHLSCDNTILTALRVLLNQPNGHLLLSNRQAQCCRLITIPMVLTALLAKFKQSALGASGNNLSAVLMQPLESILEIQMPLLTSDCSVLQALEVIHFKSLSCAAVISDRQQCNGVVTTKSLLKAFLDSMDKPFSGMA